MSSRVVGSCSLATRLKESTVSEYFPRRDVQYVVRSGHKTVQPCSYVVQEPSGGRRTIQSRHLPNTLLSTNRSSAHPVMSVDLAPSTKPESVLYLSLLACAGHKSVGSQRMRWPGWSADTRLSSMSVQVFSPKGGRHVGFSRKHVKQPENGRNVTGLWRIVMMACRSHLTVDLASLQAGTEHTSLSPDLADTGGEGRLIREKGGS